MLTNIRGVIARVLVIMAILLSVPSTAHAAPDTATGTEQKIAAAKALASDHLVGANDWSCVPSAAHPRPVVLVHGTFATGTVNWFTVAPQLASRGYCVYALTYGTWLDLDILGGLRSVRSSAAQLSTFIDGVLAATGAPKVDIVGHSQGGMMPRYYTRFLGGASKVNTLVGIAPSNYGVTPTGLIKLALSFPGAIEVFYTACPACRDQTTGSTFLRNLNTGGDTTAGVHHVVIATLYDQFLISPKAQFLTGADAHNILLQDLCPASRTEHAGIAFDPLVLHEILNHLDPPHASPTTCVSLP